uniref:peroxidase n=1 Tax=Lotus japonicus TaxID=34305 RepID=I3SMX0_LOTJA|nr:unknown [Lotus japonicus]
MRSSMCVAFLLVVAFAALSSSPVAAATPPRPKLEWHYYKTHNICRDAELYVRNQVKLFWKFDKSITAKLLRLVYSDCFITGCDASILLDEGPNTEKKAPQNRGLGAFVLIDNIKTFVERQCPGVVSCADILQLATRDAVQLAGGPGYPVFTGRKDGMRSDAASVDIPSPSVSWQEALAYFKSRGLNVLDMGTLLGAHTIGRTHCSYITDSCIITMVLEAQTLA